MRAILMSNLMGTRNHWVMAGYSLCGAVFNTVSDEEDTVGSPLCKTCDKLMKRYVVVAEVLARRELKLAERETRERLRAAQLEALGLQPVAVDDMMQVISTGDWGYVMDVDGVGDSRVVLMRLRGRYSPRLYGVRDLVSYTTEEDALRRAAEWKPATTLWVDNVDGDVWERNEATGQVRAVQFFDGTVLTPAPWGPNCYWTMETVQRDLKLTLTSLDDIRAEALRCNEPKAGQYWRENHPVTRNAVVRVSHVRGHVVHFHTNSGCGLPAQLSRWHFAEMFTRIPDGTP